MPDLNSILNLTTLGWSGVAAMALGLVAYLIGRRHKSQDDERRLRKERHEKYLATRLAWRTAAETGDATAMARLKKELDLMRDKGWHLAPVVLAVLLMAGCASKAPPPPATVLLNEHVRTMMPGEVLPDLPAGSSRWWVCTAEGLEQLLPQDAPVLQIKEEE